MSSLSAPGVDDEGVEPSSWSPPHAVVGTVEPISPVGTDGFEPPAYPVSGGCSPAELSALIAPIIPLLPLLGTGEGIVGQAVVGVFPPGFMRREQFLFHLIFNQEVIHTAPAMREVRDSNPRSLP